MFYLFMAGILTFINVALAVTYLVAMRRNKKQKTPPAVKIHISRSREERHARSRQRILKRLDAQIEASQDYGFDPDHGERTFR